MAPHECIGCGREGTLLCDGCRPDVIETLPSRCYRCHKLTPDYSVCESCRRHSPLKHVWIAASYDGLLKELMRQYKFERAKDTSKVLAHILDETAPFFPSDTVITFVPTATSRARQRGYDQAAELAQAFGRIRQLKVIPLLYREGQTRQVGSGRGHRLKQLEGTFRPRNIQNIKGASIILIDDVVTTGATLETAAKVLKSAGAKAVNGLAVAQKQ